jgi:hypothetical protein
MSVGAGSSLPRERNRYASPLLTSVGVAVRSATRHQMAGFAGSTGSQLNRGMAIKDPNRSEHLLGENPPFWNIEEKGHVLQDENIFIDRKAFGIPFIIDDDAALDAAYRHHKSAVEILSVERVLLPFWLACTSIGGHFASEVFIRDPTSMIEMPTWHEVPDYEFSYPYEDHCPFNQICATYDPVAAYAEDACAGSHIPSMLLSRFELLEELEAMEAPPRFVPFDLSTKSAVNILEKRNGRALIHRQAIKELRKYHGHFTGSNLKFYSTYAEVTKLRPTFIPAYSMKVVTAASGSKPLPLFVCGATGKTRGPIVTRTPQERFYMSAGSGGLALLAGAATTGAVFAAAASMAAVAATSAVDRYRLMKKASQDAAVKVAQLAMLAMNNMATDSKGYKWTVEDEETMEYSYREELRAKARRRADFEQRVREEAARDEAFRTGRKFKSRSRAKRRPGTVDRDPLGYYDILGFKGTEEKATAKDIGKAFRAEAQKHHPDMVAPEQQDIAKDKMQRLVEAYSVLRDPKLRKEYDDGALTTRPGQQTSEEEV